MLTLTFGGKIGDGYCFHGDFINGWFEDAQSGKPWIDGSPNAKKDFWNARNSWFPTWTSPAMEVSKVVMWQQCDGDEQL